MQDLTLRKTNMSLTTNSPTPPEITCAHTMKIKKNLQQTRQKWS